MVSKRDWQTVEIRKPVFKTRETYGSEFLWDRKFAADPNGKVDEKLLPSTGEDIIKKEYSPKKIRRRKLSHYVRSISRKIGITDNYWVVTVW
jgi:hypothetical protein